MILAVLFANSEGNIRIKKMIPSYSQPLTPHREAWSVSSCKPRNGVASLRDDSLDTYWQSAPYPSSSSPPVEISPLSVSRNHGLSRAAVGGGFYFCQVGRRAAAPGQHPVPEEGAAAGEHHE